MNVLSENADLAGRSESTRVVVGTQPTFGVANQFTNLGPTAAGNATVSGTCHRRRHDRARIVQLLPQLYFGAVGNVADDQCTVTATTFTCAPVFSGGVFYAPQPFVFYDVTLPATPTTVVASATLTGRADPDHTNDTSTVTIEVDEPAAEIYTQITPVAHPIPSQEATLVDGPVVNAGELDADELVAVFEAPAFWEITVPPGPLPPGIACEVIVTPHAMRCTRTTLPAGQGWSVDALVTPPAAPASAKSASPSPR